MVNNMKYLSSNPITNKTVLLRCDFNVPAKNKIITDNSKIIKSLDTINYLIENNNKVIILSHYGRVKKEEDKESNSLYIVYKELEKYIDLNFIDDPLNLEVILSEPNKKCFLVENTRYTDLPEKSESANNLELARYWSSFADVFVLDAFGSMHRAHSSTAGISKYLPTYIGFLAEKELENLKVLINNPTHSFLVIMGGAKVDDKISIIESMLNKCDKLVLTGGILNTFLKVAGKNIGLSLASDDEEILKNVLNVLNKYREKIYFTNKFVVKRDDLVLEVSLNEIKDGDLIYDNIPNIYDILKDTDIVFLNGTAGKYEDKKYSAGTVKLFNDLSNSDAKVIIGGGDTVSAVNNLGFDNKFYYLSSGGGATLEYVAYEKLKSLEWIKENGVDN